MGRLIVLALALALSAHATDEAPETCVRTFVDDLRLLPKEVVPDLVWELSFPMRTAGHGYLMNGTGWMGESATRLIHHEYINGERQIWYFRPGTQFEDPGIETHTGSFYMRVRFSLGGGLPECLVTRLRPESSIFQEALQASNEILNVYEQRKTVTAEEVLALRELQTKWTPDRLFFFRLKNRSEGKTLSTLGLLDHSPNPGLFTGPYDPPVTPVQGPAYEVTRTFNQMAEFRGPRLLAPFGAAVLMHRLGTFGYIEPGVRVEAVAPKRHGAVYEAAFGFRPTDRTASLGPTPLHVWETTTEDFVVRFPPFAQLASLFYSSMFFCGGY
ncbi:hypothetical protein K2X33_03415 [bacterium]|nr:hypothetical protein [bacterium]